MNLRLPTVVLCLATGGAAAQTSATTGNFSATQRPEGSRATAEFDRACSKLYDSANPVGMAFELATILGPRYLLVKVPDLSGVSPEENRRIFTALRESARRKVWLPVSAENLLGEQLHRRHVSDKQVVAAEQLNVRDRRRLAEVQKLLDAVVSTLPSDNPYTFRLHAMQGTQTNASMGVGGYLYVTLGLLRDRTLNDNDVALRLAHEVAHLTRRHSLKDLQLKMVDAMAISKDLKGMVGLATDPVAAAQGLLSTYSSTELLFQRFEQNQELEGDSCGMLVLARTPGVDAASALNAYVARAPGAGAADWDKTHPKHEEREAVMREQLQRQRTGGTPAAQAQSGTPAAAAPASGAQGGGGGFFNRLKGALPAGGASSPAGQQPYGQD